MTRLAKCAGAVTAIAAALGVVWALAADHPARPALKRELDVVAGQVAATSQAVLWLQIDHYERTKARRPLTREECARYLAIARQLGVPARC
jgi:hypothetical protein